MLPIFLVAALLSCGNQASQRGPDVGIGVADTASLSYPIQRSTALSLKMSCKYPGE